MFKELYVISKAGIPLHFYQKGASQNPTEGRTTLFSGIISAIMKFLVEVDVGDVKNFITESNQISISSAPNFAIILINDINAKINEQDVTDLFTRLSSEIGLALIDYDDGMHISDEETINKLNDIFQRIIPAWENEAKKSQAAKRLKKSLW